MGIRIDRSPHLRGREASGRRTRLSGLKLASPPVATRNELGCPPLGRGVLTHEVCHTAVHSNRSSLEFRLANPLRLARIFELSGSRFLMISASQQLQMQAADSVVLKASDDVLRQRLTPSVEKLFAELTGLRLHVSWLYPFTSQKSGTLLVLCPDARRIGPLSALAGRCQACLKQNWSALAQSPAEGCRFVGRCGSVNFCCSLHVGGASPHLLLLLHARISGGRAPRRSNAESLAPSSLTQQPALQSARVSRCKAPSCSKPAFDRAVALVRLIKEELEASLQACMAQTAMGHLRSQVQDLETENTWLRAVTRERSAELRGALTVQASGSHRQQIVRGMMAYVHEHYHHPMSLGDVAAALRMNAAYLSSLFSATVGVTFHKFLEGVRLTKARELLANPHFRICEVACAVGYASANQFRHAFKANIGVPPSSSR